MSPERWTAVRSRLGLKPAPYSVIGIPPQVDAASAAAVKARLIKAVSELADRHQLDDVTITVTNRRAVDAASVDEGIPAEPPTPTADDRAAAFVAEDPDRGFDALVLPEPTLRQLFMAIDMVIYRETVFDTWNLRSIQPHPGSAINLHGKPGTGKSLAAHAIADHLGKKIIRTKYSQLESKYHGEGPKNLAALFASAMRHDAVLFLDEADSLMSRRFENTSHGSEHAINAMRSELLLCLDRFEGMVVFATNLVGAYDPAFDTRIRHVHIPEPDVAARREIWRRHLPPELPLAADVSVDELAEAAAVTGREINRAVIDAAVAAARNGRRPVTQRDLRGALEAITASLPRAPEPIRWSEVTDPPPPSDPQHVNREERSDDDS